VVGEPDGRHFELGGTGGQGGHAAGSVEDRVLGVDVQVDEARLGHGKASLEIRSADIDACAHGIAATCARASTPTASQKPFDLNRHRREAKITLSTHRHP
jgi:hypothetical protein